MDKPGPRTAKGKAVARMNATRHGINSNSPVIAGLESEDAWQAHHTGVLESLQPEGTLELMLAGRVALQSWRLQRVMRYEREAIEIAQQKVQDDLNEQLERERSRQLEIAERQADPMGSLLKVFLDPATRASIESQFPIVAPDANVDRRAQWQDFLERERLLPDESTLNKIMRYEAHLSRQMYQALHELEALQTRRMGGVSPLARLEVHGLPEESNG